MKMGVIKKRGEQEAVISESRLSQLFSLYQLGGVFETFQNVSDYIVLKTLDYDALYDDGDEMVKWLENLDFIRQGARLIEDRTMRLETDIGWTSAECEGGDGRNRDLTKEIARLLGKLSKDVIEGGDTNRTEEPERKVNENER